MARQVDRLKWTTLSLQNLLLDTKEARYVANANATPSTVCTRRLWCVERLVTVCGHDATRRFVYAHDGDSLTECVFTGRGNPLGR